MVKSAGLPIRLQPVSHDEMIKMKSKILPGLKLHRERGFVLVTAAIGFAVVLGAAGLAVDLGRVYITRSEAQAFADSAALAAATQLNGTSVGITAANAAVQNTPNRWNIGTQSFSGTTVEFALASLADPNQADATTFTANPASAANYRFQQQSEWPDQRFNNSRKFAV